ncbi:MAG: sugar-binding protein [Kiritimatiellae bacterium]|nr:sugar-binding protein [Kiritimatiellia bacterium]
MRPWMAAVLAGLTGVTVVMGQQERRDRVQVVPRVNEVTVDGDLKDWDLSAAIDTALDEKLRPLFTVQIALMYDAEALYIGAHFADDTPMLNRHDPSVEAANGWAGDCLQIHLCSDADQPYPLPVKIEADTVCDLILWNYTDRREPVLFTTINWGKFSRLYTGADSGLAFRTDQDQKGYTLEARIPWSRLNAPRAPQAGEKIAFLLKPFWGDATGTKHASFFADVVREGGFAYANSAMWGRAEFLEKGNLTASAKPKTATERRLPVRTALRLPDKKATTVSAAIYSRSNVMVRTLLAGATAEPMDQAFHGARIVKRAGAKVHVAWDGCDDAGKPLPAGEYSLKVLTSRGIGQKWVASVHNAGNPPWYTDDGTGSWGGDHAPPVAAAADEDRVYLAWAASECGPAVIACRPDGQKLWGAKSVSMDVGFGFYALAADGQYVYLLQDGYLYGQGPLMGEVKTNYPAIIRWDAATGKPVNFPFGKRCLMVGEWPDSLQRPDFTLKNVGWNHDYAAGAIENTHFKRPWEKHQTHDYGPQEFGRNALGLAVHISTAYVTKYLENKAVAFEMQSGKLVREWSLPSPVGLAAATNGTIYAVSGKSIVKLMPDGTVAPVVKDSLSSPWGLAVGKDGLLYVSDCGDQMQVKVFDLQGQLVRTIGKKGGRAWVGGFDRNGLLEPAGLAIDRDNKLWVCEYDWSPLRISTWAAKDGKFLKEYFGPGTYSVRASVNPERPNLVLAHNTWFDVNFATGTVKPVGTFHRTIEGLQFRAIVDKYMFHRVKGRTYACSVDLGGAVVFLVKEVGGVPVGEPVAAWGTLPLLQFNGIRAEDLPAEAREKYWPTRNKQTMFQWHDLNGDRLIQDDEWTFSIVADSRLKAHCGFYWGNWSDDSLTFWTRSYDPENQVVAWRVKEWKGDVPIYTPYADLEPTFKLGARDLQAAIPDKDGVYINRDDVFGSQVKRGSVEKRDMQGELLWSYARSYSGLNAPLPSAGDMPCAGLRTMARTPDGLSLLFFNAYYGQYFLMEGDGLYVGALCKDSRTGPKCGPDTILMENFNGHFFRNKDDGKYYAIGGDTDARIWEVTGIDTLKKGTMPLTIRPEDAASSAAALRKDNAGKTGPADIRVRKVPSGFRAEDPAAWDLTDTVAWDAGAGRTAKAALAHDGANLYAIYQVADTSPMANGGKEWETLFKCGDTCEIMLAANPGADATRSEPAAGDMRLLFSVMEDQPIAVMYEAVARPGEEKAPRAFNSASRGFPFDRVVQLKNAVVKVAKAADGYVLSAVVPLKDIGFVLTADTSTGLGAGLKTKGDVGVLFSNDGGTVTARRTYYFNQNTSITGDLPSEAQLQPASWGVVEVE